MDKDQRVPEKIPLWDAAADCLVENSIFPLSLTTSSGQNAQIQAETTCWSQQGCLPLDFDACVTNGKQNPTGKDLHKRLRASPYTGAGSLSEIRLSKCVFKNPPWSTIAKLSASVPVL